MKKVKVGKSKIHGNGLFADEPIKRGDVIELVHTMRELEPGVMKTTPTLLGRNYNHSDDSNALNVVDGNNRYLVALKEIEVGGEITTDYRTNPELEQPGSFASNDNYISFDYDDTLTTPEGFKLAQQMNKEGKNLYVITARDKVTPQMIERAEAAGIPKENIITAGSDEAKVKIVKENNISKHIDNKESVIKALGDTGELFTPDAYPDLKADFIEMDLTTDDLNKLKEGGFIVEESPDKGIITQEEIDAANNAMMKARLAYAYMHGNPAAQRMVVAPDQPYDFGDGMTGTHYMASMDNYAVPQIQDVNGQLMLGDYGPESAEAIRFDTDQDANYFAENYKQVTPDPSYRQEEYAKGGDPGKGKKGKSKNVQPFVTSNPAEYAYRKAAYDDSLNLYNLNKNFRDVADKYFFTEYNHLTKPTTKNTKAAIEEWKKVNAAADKFNLYKRKSKVENEPSGSFKNIRSGLSNGYGNINVNAPGVKVLKKQGRYALIESNNPGYQKPVQPVQFKKQQPPIVEQEVIEPTPIPQPVPTPIIVNPELQKFVEERRPEPPGPPPGIGADVMPVYDTDELPMYATPDGGAEWIGDTERYVDWDGNRIPYRLPRFRKPGHGGDLIRQGKKRYIPFPSIESRYQAEIVPEEEYKKGGEPKKRKKDSKGRYRSEDGNIRTPLTPEMQAVMPPEEWGQYVQEVPEVYTTRTREQQDIKNALDYQNRMAELYPGMPTQSDAIQPADWLWQLGMLGATSGLGKSAVQAAEAAGSRALPYITGALETSIPGMASVPGATVGNALASGFAGDAIVNRLLPAPGKIQEGEYGEAAADVATGVLDLWGANMLSPVYKGAKATVSELGKFLGSPNNSFSIFPKQPIPLQGYNLSSGQAYKTLLPEAVQEEKTIASVAQTPKEPWKMQPMSGLHLKSTMTDGAISKIVEPKTGLINLDQALGIIAKESGGADKVAIIKQGLGENLPKKMDFNEFRKVVQDQLIPLETQVSDVPNSAFGLHRIGYTPGADGVTIYGSKIDDLDNAKIIENKTLVFSNKDKFGRGSDVHSNSPETLGHVHYFIDDVAPDALTITQIQSDAFQGPYRVMPKNIKDIDRLEKQFARLKDKERIQTEGRALLEKQKMERLDVNGNSVPDHQLKYFEQHLDRDLENIQLEKSHLENMTQKSLLDKNHQERYLQEIIDYAAKRGDVNRIKLPTPETANSIQNYTAIETFSPEMTALRQKIVDASESGDRAASIQAYTDYEIALENARLNAQKAEENIVKYKKNKLKELEQELGSNDPTVEKLKSEITILEKYQEYPKIIKKLYGTEPKKITDGKGNTWYEFNIPYEFKEGPAEIKAFRYGGTNNKLAKFIR